MTTKKFTPIIKRGPRLTPGEINVTPPDDLGIEIPPSGIQKALPWVMGGGMLGNDRDHDLHRRPATLAVHADDAVDDDHGDRRVHGRGRTGRQAGARNQRRPQGISAVSVRVAHAGDVVGIRSGDVLQLSRATSRRSAVDHRHQPTVVASGQRRLLRRYPDRHRRRTRGRPATQAGGRGRTRRTPGRAAAAPGAGQPYVVDEVPAHPRVDPRLPETGAAADLSDHRRRR